MDGGTDRWTDRPSYRDARMHLKMQYFQPDEDIKNQIGCLQWYSEKYKVFGPMEKQRIMNKATEDGLLVCLPNL